ncbi:lysophospholipase L1-like esterase [Opitutaceae bacterium TAV1]|nr:lysophospholipase L1-like esterase [Opitutaceae bacterium TAV1]
MHTNTRLAHVLLTSAALCLSVASTLDAVPTANLADFGALPGSEHDSAPAFAKAIAWLAQNPGGTLTIPEGVFHLKTNPAATLTSGNKSDAHLNFDHLKNITLAGQSPRSEIVFGQFAPGLLFENCDGLTLRNLTFDYAFLLFSQGRVLEINDGTPESSLLLQADPGYPPPATQPGTIFGRARSTWLTLHRNGMNLAYPEALDAVNATPTQTFPDGTVRFYYRNQKNVSKRLAGDPAEPLRYTRPSRYAGQLIRLRNCNDVLLDTLRIHAASGFTVLGSTCRNVTVRNCLIAPRPGTDRVIATCADGLHFIGGQGKYLVENNTFDSLQDDNVNIILRGNTIDAQPCPDTLVLTPGSVRHYAAGDTVRLADIENNRHSDYTITRVETLPGARHTLTLDRPVTGKIVFASALQQSPLLRQPAVVHNRSWAFGDVTIRGNKFLNNRARGVRITGSGVTVENNTFDLSAFPAILIHSIIRDVKDDEYNAFAERVIIRDNIIKRAINNGGASGNGGAITIEVLDAYRNVPRGFYPFRDIAITGNRIENPGRAGIAATNVNGLVIEDNIITNPNRLRSPRPSARAGIYLNDVENVRVENNRVTGDGFDAPVYREPLPPLPAAGGATTATTPATPAEFIPTLRYDLVNASASSLKQTGAPWTREAGAFTSPPDGFQLSYPDQYSALKTFTLNATFLISGASADGGGGAGLAIGNHYGQTLSGWSVMCYPAQKQLVLERRLPEGRTQRLATASLEPADTWRLEVAVDGNAREWTVRVNGVEKLRLRAPGRAVYAYSGPCSFNAAARFTAFGIVGGDSYKPVIALGDSITHHIRWTEIVSEKTGLAIGNAGMASDDTAGALARIDSDVIKLRPRFAVVFIGTNDGNRNQAESNIGTILDRLGKAGIQPILCTLLPRKDKPINETINEFLRTLAARHQTPLVDWHDALQGPPGELTARYASGTVHPNDAGAERMAEIFIDTPALQPVFQALK